MKYPKLILMLTFISLSLNSACGTKASGKSPAPVELPWDYAGYNFRPAVQDTSHLLVNFDGRYTEQVQAIPFIDSNQEDLVKEILDHTYVSQPWMGKRFAELLKEMPTPILKLAGCSKIIVLDAKLFGADSNHHLVRFSGDFLAQSEEELKNVKRIPAITQTSEIDFRWGYFHSYEMSWREGFSKDQTLWQSRKLQFALTHEFMHACDEKYIDANGDWISASLPKVAAKLPSQYYARAITPWIKDEAFEQSINWEDFTREHMASLASDSYGYMAQTENLAQLTSHYLSYIYSNWDSYEIYYVPNPEVKSGFEQNFYFGAKNKFCDPRLQQLARDFLNRVAELNEANLDKDLVCQPELFPKVGTIESALKKMENYHEN